MRSLRSEAIEAFLYFEKKGSLPPRPRFPDARDARYWTKLVKGVFRHRGQIDALAATFIDRPVEEIDLDVLYTLRLAIFDLFALNTASHAAIHEAVESTKLRRRSASGWLNAVLRKAAQAKAPDWTQGNLSDALPKDLARQWNRILSPRQAEEAAHALLSEPATTLRVNRTRITRLALANTFREQGIKLELSTYLPDAIVLREHPPIVELPGYHEGFFYVQNEASQLAAYVVAPREGERILDAAAAPGGKATHIAELAHPHGDVTALDRDDRGLERLEENARRLGLNKITIAHGDLVKPRKQRSLYDKVLLDAPCSSWGVLHRHPEYRWNKDADGPRKLSETQAEMLEAASAHTKPGGKIIYSVCTFSTEETTEMIERFVTYHRDVARDDPREGLPPHARTLGTPNEIQFFPGHDTFDGFYYVRLHKR